MSFQTKENSTALYTAQIVDETNTPIPAASLFTVKLTLTNRDDNSVINNRNEQNVLNANNVTIDSSGNLAWTLQPADNPIVNSKRRSERHIALFDFTWASGAKATSWQVDIDCVRVVNEPIYPTP